MKYFITILFSIFIGNLSWAQSHRLTAPTNCKFAKVQATSNYINCDACYEKEKEDNEFKKELADKREYERLKYGALAIDRSNGFYYGFAHDYSTREEAEDRAVRECEKKGGNCSVVLVYSGEACASYRTVQSNQGTAYGWGVASTREEADNIATRECLRRSGGIAPTNYVWSCNSKSLQKTKVLYEAPEGLPIISKKNKLGSAKFVHVTKDESYYTLTGAGVIQIMEIPSFQLVFDVTTAELDLGPNNPRVTSAVLSPDYKYLYLAHSRGVHKIDFKTKQVVGKINLDLYEPSLDITGNGNYVFVTTESRIGKNYIISTNQMTQTAAISNGEFGVNYVTISPNGSVAALSGIDGSYRFISIPNGNVLVNKHIGGNVQRGKFSSDGRKITMSIFDEDDKDNSIADYTRVLDVSTGNVLKKYGLLKSFGYSSCFLDKDTKVVEADYSGAIKILDYQTGSVLQTFQEPYKYIYIDPIKSGTAFIAGGFDGLSYYVKDANGKYVLKKDIDYSK